MSPGSGVASSADSSGTTGRDEGVAPEPLTPLAMTESGDGVEADNKGTEEIEAAGGSPMSTPDNEVVPALTELLPEDGRGNYHNERPTRAHIKNKAPVPHIQLMAGLRPSGLPPVSYCPAPPPIMIIIISDQIR